MKPKESQFPDPNKHDDRPEGWDYLTPESMDEITQQFIEKPDKDKYCLLFLRTVVQTAFELLS